MSHADLYKQAGVDVDAGNEAAKRYAKLAAKTRRPEVLGGIGGFAGGFQLDVQRFPNPVLISGTDGVGTKLKVAFAANRHDTIGIDCVAMCVNDVLTTGAEPLFFLDYFAVGKLEVDVAESVVAGVANGCELAGCALVGGETAEMPDVYADGEYDVAGTTVGVVNREEMIDGSRMATGDVVLGLASSGVHSNGFSLIRKLIAEAGLDWNANMPGTDKTVADELLTPTRIYVKSILHLLNSGIDIKGMAHITGGGIIDNLPRCLPNGVNARLKMGSWPILPVFQWLQEQAGMTFAEAARVWNMGIGFVIVVDEIDADRALNMLNDLGEKAYRIGAIEAASADVSGSAASAGAHGTPSVTWEE